MDKLTKKTHTTSRSYTYTYYHYQPTPPTSKPTLLLCHGWPDSADLWTGVVPFLLDLGHPLLIPDCLGYGGTSKPSDYKEYTLKAMANDMWEIVANESIDSIIPVGHDWGSALAQRVYLYRPEKCSGLIVLNVAYLPPSSTPYDLDSMNKMTEQAYGYPCFAYWDVFAADDGPEILLENVETLFHAIHWDHPEAMKTFFATYSNTREMLQTASPSDFPLKPYAQTPGFKDAFISRMKRDGFEGPQSWYKCMARNVNLEDESELSKKSQVIQAPVLYISGDEDWVCRTDGMERVKDLIPDLVQHVVHSNHWITFENPEKVGKIIAGWLKEKY